MGAIFDGIGPERSHEMIRESAQRTRHELLHGRGDHEPVPGIPRLRAEDAGDFGQAPFVPLHERVEHHAVLQLVGVVKDRVHGAKLLGLEPRPSGVHLVIVVLVALSVEIDGQLPQQRHGVIRGRIEAQLIGEQRRNGQSEEAGHGHGQCGSNEASFLLRVLISERGSAEKAVYGVLHGFELLILDDVLRSDLESVRKVDFSGVVLVLVLLLMGV